MGFSGDIGKLGQLARNLGKLAAVPSRAAPAAAEAIEALIREEFSAESDPYGNGWAAHAEGTIERWGEHALLQLNNAMLGSLDVSPMAGAGIAITIDHPAGVHQTGASSGNWEMPARPVLPSGTFPASWSAALKSAGRSAIGQTMGGK